MTRSEIIERYRASRRRTAGVFTIPKPEAYYDRPIALRNPVVFYEGHLPAFNVNTLLKLTFGERGIDEHYEELFARGIDPETPDGVSSADQWPSRECVQKYGRQADARIEEELSRRDVVEATCTILEHELMHQETLLYMFHEMPYQRKNPRPPFSVAPAPSPPLFDATARVKIPAGEATLGREAGIFGWDNEFPRHRVFVDAFEIDRYNVTNADYLEYVNATSAEAPHFWRRENGSWYWRGMFGSIPLPLDWPVYVTHDEAAAYAEWRDARLPTEAEYHRAAFGTPDGTERSFPWGDASPDPTRGNFGFAHWEPVAVGSYPQGASAWGVHDLVGNGWEWTSTLFAPYDGFQPMRSYPQYSADFFDSKHYVLKGASPATAPELIRASFRNWFRPNYPYVYAAFRCVR